MNEHLKSEQRETDGGKLASNSFDYEIDSVLKRYSVEPRAGLEDRVLANLRTNRERTSAHNWWQWMAVSAAATFVLAASIILWRSTQTRRDYSAQPLQTMHDQISNRTQAAARATNQIPTLQTMSEKKKPTTHPSRHTFAAGPKLAQFPSLQPLNEQERLLIRFVEEFPQEAALIATAQVESEKKLEQLNGSQPSETNPDQQDQQER
jgi:hypothetical protein